MTTKFKVQKIYSKIDYETKAIIGCKAVARDRTITDIAGEFNVERKFVYEQEAFVLNAIRESQNKPKHQIVVMTNLFIARIIIACMLLCKGSTEDTQRFLRLVFDIKISIGKISNVINKASLNAKLWNESVDLSRISTGANDEIFQGSNPILVGVDPKSTFIYLFSSTSNRDANAWGCTLLEKVEKQRLWLTSAVSDSGKGIIRGTKDVFGDNISYQADIFHVKYDFNKGLKSLENYAYRCILQHQKLLNKKTKKTISNEEIEKLKAKEVEAIQQFDHLNILFTWIGELLEIGGYFYEDRLILFKFIIVQLEELKIIKNSYLKKSISYIKNNVKQILEFVIIAENTLSKLAIVEKVDENILRKIWIQERYKSDSAEYNYIEAEIGSYLGDRYWEIRGKYIAFKKDITRASSIVECINSLIRPYIDLKRSIGDNFIHLLQMHFNTRTYRRSRIKEREKKSPYELLTGNRCENILDVLCPNK